MAFFVVYLLCEGLVMIAKSALKPRGLDPDVALSCSRCTRASQPRFAFSICHSEFGLVLFHQRRIIVAVA